MKQITLNIPSSSIDQELYQYDGLYRENQLVSKELDQDIVQNITFENSAPVNFKIKTTPYLTYESFLPETEHNLFSIQQVNTINTDLELTTIYPKNDKVFVIKKVTSPQIIISSFKNRVVGDSTILANNFFNITTNDLGYDYGIHNHNVNISSALGNKNDSFGVPETYISSCYTLFFAASLGGLSYPQYIRIDTQLKSYIVPIDNEEIKYTAKDNTKLDGTYENISLTPPNDQIVKPSNKLVQVPLFLTECTIPSGFITNDAKPLFYVSNFPIFEHTEGEIMFSFFGIEEGKKCVGYYPLSLENNAVRLAFFDKTYNTKNDKSSSFYDIDLENSAFGIQMPTESKMLSVKVSTHTTEHAQTYDMPLDIITGVQFNKWPSEKYGKPSYVIFQPDIKVKPKTATVDVEVKFNFADAEMTLENKEGIKNALTLNMIDGEWDLATSQKKSFEGIIADPIA